MQLGSIHLRLPRVGSPRDLHEAGPCRVVPFVVHTCTEYEQRNHPDWDRMKEMAVPLRENRKKSLGFSGAGFGLTLADEDEETQDAALIASA